MNNLNYEHEFDNLDKMDLYLKKRTCKLPKLTQYHINN